MRKLRKIGLYFIAIFTFVIFIIPIVWMCVSSFKPAGSPISMIDMLLKPPFTIENYINVLTNTMLVRWVGNSIFVAVAVTITTIFITSMAGYALSRIDFKFNKIVFTIILMGIMIPTEAIIIPLYDMMSQRGMLNSYVSLIFPSLAAPLGVIIFKQFYDAIPKELMEAATIDGANIFQIWYKIYVPLSQNAFATVAILAFVGSWNNFLWPFLSITNERMMTLPVAIPTFSSAYKMDMVIPMTVNFISSIPAIIIFIIFQKGLIKGISSSGIKG